MVPSRYQRTIKSNKTALPPTDLTMLLSIFSILLSFILLFRKDYKASIFIEILFFFFFSSLSLDRFVCLDRLLTRARCRKTDGRFETGYVDATEDMIRDPGRKSRPWEPTREIPLHLFNFKG